MEFMVMISRLIALPALLLLASQNAPFSPEPAKDVQEERLKLIKDLFKDDYARRAPADQQALASSPSWKARDPKFPLFVGAYGTRFRFHKILLTPVSGQGKKLR